MTRWERTDGGLRATDGERDALVVDGAEWHPEAEGPVAVGPLAELSLPRAPATLEPDGVDAPAAVGAGPRALVVEAARTMTVRFEGPATVEVGDRVHLSFPERRRVSVAVDSSASAPADALTAPPTPEGVAAALTAAGATPETTGPARSAPEKRPYPPRFAFERGASLPDPEPATDVELLVSDLESLFPAAPLAYYAGADVRIEPGEPRLRAPKADFTHSLGEGAAAAPALYRAAFRADCLLRERDPRAERAGFADLAEAPMGERLARYADATFDSVSLPAWPLAAYVEASVERAPLLSHLLARGASIHPPETEPLSGKALMERSLDSFYRSAPTPRPVDVCEPTLAAGELHCWHAPETPIDVYEGRLAAYENRLERGETERPLRVRVVCNEDRMRREGRDVADVYREEGTNLDVRHDRNLTRDALADALRAETDLLHFIGHCEPEGLRCADGALAAEELDAVGARTFLLNACGSYREGLDLLDAGAVAGAVTYRQVLDEQAARVGTTFARLLADGFSVERGLDLARRRVMMGKDYAVVGDGTHAVVRSARAPLVAEVESEGEEYEVSISAARDGDAGARYLPPFPDATPRLLGDDATRTLDADALRALCERTSMPVVFDGEFRWSEAFAAELE